MLKKKKKSLNLNQVFIRYLDYIFTMLREFFFFFLIRNLNFILGNKKLYLLPLTTLTNMWKARLLELKSDIDTGGKLLDTPGVP